MLLVIQFRTSFHGVEDKYFHLAYDAVYSDRWVTTYRRNLDGSSSAAVLGITQQAYRKIWLPSTSTIRRQSEDLCSVDRWRSSDNSTTYLCSEYTIL